MPHMTHHRGLCLLPRPLGWPQTGLSKLKESPGSVRDHQKRTFSYLMPGSSSQSSVPRYTEEGSPWFPRILNALATNNQHKTATPAVLSLRTKGTILSGSPSSPTIHVSLRGAGAGGWRGEKHEIAFGTDFSQISYSWKKSLQSILKEPHGGGSGTHL
jgi:hypothetical protein